jgi:hypothetical protein
MGLVASAPLVPGSVAPSDLVTPFNMPRAQLAVVPLDVFTQSLSKFKKFDSVDLGLPAAATGSYMGLNTGTVGSAANQVATTDSHSASLTTKARDPGLIIPNDFAGTGFSPQVQIYLRAGMKTTVAGTSATLTVAAYKVNLDGTVGSNLVSTGGQSINSLTAADFFFVLSASGLNPGDVLDVLVTIAIVDASGSTAVIGVINKYALLCSTQG